MAKYRNIAPRFESPRFAMPMHESRVTAAGRAQFRRIDRKVIKPKIMAFRQEYKYCKPPNTGDARNPVIFGRIPKKYQEQERRENQAVLYTAGLANTNKTKYIARVQSMNFRPPSNSASIKVTCNLVKTKD